jgi:hypothetical protein
MKIFLNTIYWTRIHTFVILFTSFVPYLIYIAIASLVPSFFVYQTAHMVYSSPDFYLITFLTFTLIIIYEYLAYAIQLIKGVGAV